MKSLTAVCQTGASMPAINPNGRVTRHPPQRGDGENAEMKMYLSKLKDLVPFMPKNRKLSKLEIIQHVIDYICDLQSELETHPEIGSFDAASALNFNATQASAESSGDEMAMHSSVDAVSMHLLQRQSEQQSQQQQQQQQAQNSSPATRQPLVDRQAPNTILPVVAANNGSSNVAPAPVPVQQQQQQQQQLRQQQQQLNNALTHTTEKDSRQPC